MMFSVPAMISRIAANIVRPAPLMGLLSVAGRNPKAAVFRARGYFPCRPDSGARGLGSDGAPPIRAWERGGGRAGVPLLSRPRLGELGATGLIAPLRPPRTGTAEADRRHPGHRWDEHADHRGAHLALDGGAGADRERDGARHDDRGDGAPAGVERDEADDYAS